MSKTHDQRCLDANRFGDGFDCICEPDWKAKCVQLEKQIAELKAELKRVALNAENDEMAVREAHMKTGKKLHELKEDWALFNHCSMRREYGFIHDEPVICAPPDVQKLTRDIASCSIGTCEKCKQIAPLREEQSRSVGCDHEGCFGDCGRTVTRLICAWEGGCRVKT